MSRRSQLFGILLGGVIAAATPFGAIYAQSESDTLQDAARACERNIAGRNEFADVSESDKAIAQACETANDDPDKAWHILLNRDESPSATPLHTTTSGVSDWVSLIISLTGVALSYVVFRASSRPFA
jgi:hypothetical protein